MILHLDLTNNSTNGLSYAYQGQVEFWLVMYSGVTNERTPGEFTFKKLLGSEPLITATGNGRASLSISNDVLETIDVSGTDYMYIEARYVLNGEEIAYTGTSDFLGNNLFYTSITSPPQDEITFSGEFDDFVAVTLPDLHTYTFAFKEEGTQANPLPGLSISGKVYDNTSPDPVLLLDLGTAETDSMGVVSFQWINDANQESIKVTVESYTETPSSSYTLTSENEEQAIVVISASTVIAEQENIVPGATSAAVLTELGITPSTELSNFINDVDHPLTSLREVRKGGYLADLSGYDTLSQGDKDDLDRLQAQALLNLLYFPDSHLESISKYIEFNDLLFTDAGNPVTDAIDIVTKFSPGDFVAHGRTLRAGMVVGDQPSDFALAAIYSLAQRQFQVNANFLSSAAADLKYKNGTDAGSIVFSGAGHTMDCDCEECMTAVSPLSYLSSLITYAEQNVNISTGGKATLTSLEDFLNLPLTSLKLDCNEVSKRLCNFRAQVETLYKYKLSLPLPDPIGLVPGAKAAYGFRKLISTYSGYAVRVRRSSDNDETDIGFQLEGRFDILAFNDFIGAGTGWCVKIYDQTGNGQHYQQTNTSWQAQILIDGNNVPYLDLTGTNRYNQVTEDKPYWKFLHDGSGANVFCVIQTGKSINPGVDYRWMGNISSSSNVGVLLNYQDNAVNNRCAISITRGTGSIYTAQILQENVWTPDVPEQITWGYIDDAGISNDLTFREEGSQKAFADTGNSPSSSNATLNLSFFGRSDVNPGATGSQSVEGRWYEFLFYPGLTDGNIELLEQNQIQYLNALGSTQCDLRIFNIMKANFLQSAYFFFLNYIGTGFNELQAAQNDTDNEESLAEVLGLPLIYGVSDHPVQLLYFDVSIFDNNLSTPLNAAFTSAISTLETLLEDIFGFRKDSTDPLLDLGDCDYLLWRQEFIRNQWESEDNPENEWLTEKNYYFDPDVVNIDDLRYPVDSSGYPVTYPSALPDTFLLLENRKNWSGKISDFLTQPAMKSSAGFVQANDKIKLDLPSDSSAKVVPGTPVLVSKMGINPGTFVAKELINNVNPNPFELELETPFPQESLNTTAKVRFEIGYEISAFDATNAELTIPENTAQFFSGAFIRFYNPLTYKARIVAASKTTGVNDGFTYDASLKTEIENDFPTADLSEVYFQIETGVDQNTPVIFGGSNIVIFHDDASAFNAADIEFEVFGSDENDGFYATDGAASLVQYLAGGFIDFDVDTVEIPVKRTNLPSSTSPLRSFIKQEPGKGKIAYKKSGGTIAYYSNGYSLEVDASNLSLQGNDIKEGDEVLLNEDNVFTRVALAYVDDISGTTESLLVLQEALPSNYLSLMLAGGFGIKILVKATYFSATELRVDNRDLDGFALADVCVFDVNDFETEIAVSNLQYTGTVPNDYTEVTGSGFQSGTSYVLAIKNVVVENVNRSGPYFKLSTQVTNLEDRVSPGIKVEIFNSTPQLIGTFSGEEASDGFTLFVKEPITLSGADTLDFYPEFTIVNEFTRYVHLDGANTDIFGELATAANTEFRYSSVIGTTVDTDPTVWTNGADPDFLALLKQDVSDIKNGLTVSLPAAMNLNNAAFIRFTDIYTKHYNYLKDPANNENISEEESRELDTIIRLSIKNAIVQADAWENEEEDLLLSLQSTYPEMQRLQDPRIFQLSTYAPKITTFDSPLYYDPNTPYLDGQFPLLAKTPGSRPGETARDMLVQREAETAWSSEAFTEYFNTNGADAFFRAVWSGAIASNSSDFFAAIYNNLYSTSPATVLETQELLSFLGLDQSTFEKLKGLRDEWVQKKQLPEATALRDEIITLVLTAFKGFSTSSYWLNEEFDTFTTSQLFQYWRVRQEKLIPWLTSAESRANWIKAITTRQAYVAVDPDIIDIKYFRDITSTDPTIRAFTLMQDRLDELLDWITPTGSGGTLPSPTGAANDTEEALFYVGYFLELTDTVLLGLFDAIDLGSDITPQLAQLNCTPAEFYRIKQLIDSLGSSSVMFSDIEDELFNILVNVRKIRTYSEWRDGEVVPPTGNDIPVLISPEFFKDPVAEYGLEENFNSSRRWRFNETMLQIWKKLFRARALIWSSVSDNIEEMVSTADEATMMILRNAYIELTAPAVNATGKKYSFAEKSQLLSDRLLQDFEVACCSPVTRVSNAISVMQRFFYILNTETDEEKYPVLDLFILNAPYFEKEWKWLGSYGSFRSAMFVYIYPENLLHPALRRSRTTMFADIIQRLNEGGVFTPDSACKIANEYKNYLADVSNLNPQVGANCLVLDKAGPCADKSETGLKKMFFGFGKGGYSNRIYYTRQEVDATESGCFDWIEMEQFGEHVVRIIGACPAKKSDGKRYLYVFAQIREKAEESIVFLKYDLDELTWDEEYEEMEFPEGVDHSSVITLQRHNEELPVLLYLKTTEDIPSFWMNMISSFDDSWNWENPIPMGSPKWFYNYHPVGAIEVKVSPDKKIYPIGDITIVYKERWRNHILVQPFALADPDFHFYHIGRFRPGKMYGVSNNYELVLINDSDSSGNIIQGPYDGRLGDFEYKGMYCHGTDSDRQFGLLLKQGNAIPRLFQLEMQDVGSSEFNSFNTSLDFLNFTRKYFNVGFHDVPVYLGGHRFDLFQVLVYGEAESKSLSGLTLQQVDQELYYMGLTPDPDNVDWQKKYWELEALKDRLISPHGYAGKRSELFTALTAMVSDELNNNQENNPLWGIIHLTIWSFAEVNLAESGAVLNPGTNRSSRPTEATVFRKIILNPGQPGIYSIYGNSDTQREFKIVKAGVAQVSKLTHLLTNSFLPQTDNISVGWKNSMPVIFRYNTSVLTSLATSFVVTLLPTTGYNLPITSNKNSVKFQQNRVQLKTFFLANKNQCHIMMPYTEGYYFLPVLFGLKLHEGGYFEESLAWFRSVYDYNWKTLSERKIWYGLINEEANNINYSLAPEWLRDPLNPHNIVKNRAGAYTAFTVQSIVKCLLDYADQQFTIDTSESIPIATHLYEEVEQLMALEQFAPNAESCSCGTDTETKFWGQLRCLGNIGILLEHKQAIDELVWLLDQVESCADKDALLDSLASYFTFGSVPTVKDIYTAIASVQDAIIALIALNPPSVTIQSFLSNAVSSNSIQSQNLLKVPGFNLAAEAVSNAAIQDIALTYQTVTGYNLAALNDTASTPLAFTVLNSDGPTGAYTQGNQVFADERKVMLSGANSGFSLVNASYETTPLSATQNETIYQYEWTPGYSAFAYCIPDNPVYESYRLRAELNLFKIRNCFNIAGMKRELDPYSAPTDATTGLPSIGAGGRLNLPGQLVIKPTQYRYVVLIQRAKELVQQAQQLESVYLASLEKKDAETYTLTKAKQDLKLSKANVKLSDLKVKISEGEVDLAKLQMERSQIQVQELNNMIQQGLNQFEQQLIGAYEEIIFYGLQLANLQGQQTLYSSLAGVAGHGLAALTAAGLFWNASNAVSAVAHSTSAVQSGIQAFYAMPIAKSQMSLTKAQGNASIFSVMASLENRKREWQFQKVLGEQDIRIGQQQVRVAQDRLRVSGQEYKMAEMQQSFAEDSLEFLKNKFTNAELYTWMSRVLASAYSTVLNEATALAKLAMYQLIFDRQQQPPVEIADNYWEAPSMDVSLEQTTGPDRRGITGSYRLQQDLTRMDGWAFTTDTRKLEISKTISLARMFPLEFQEFRRTGKITFNTLMEYFDRDFPGHYMRIVRRVSTNVIALVPPTEGIKATLSSSGISEVVIKGDRFQNTFIRRTPERIAISNPTNNTGLLELQPQAEQFNNPFEGNGVAMQWEFEMPIESNLLDYTSISDVLLTIQYTAMDSADYRNEVLRKLPKEYEGERLFSFRNDFADQFYELSHPQDSSTPYQVSFDTLRFDFPGNLQEYYIKGVRIALITTADELSGNSAKPLGIKYRPYGPNTVEANAIAKLDQNNFASTLGGGSPGLTQLIGKSIEGSWTFDFSTLNSALGGATTLSELIDKGEIADVLFVIEFGAEFRRP